MICVIVVSHPTYNDACVVLEKSFRLMVDEVIFLDGVPFLYVELLRTYFYFCLSIERSLPVAGCVSLLRLFIAVPTTMCGSLMMVTWRQCNMDIFALFL